MYEGALRGDIGHGADGYYFGENGEHSMYEVAESIGEALSKRGLGQAEPKTLSQAELDKYIGGVSWNTRGGWPRPVKLTAVHLPRNELARPGPALEGDRLEAKAHEAGLPREHRARHGLDAEAQPRQEGRPVRLGPGPADRERALGSAFVGVLERWTIPPPRCTGRADVWSDRIPCFLVSRSDLCRPSILVRSDLLHAPAVLKSTVESLVSLDLAGCKLSVRAASDSFGLAAGSARFSQSDETELVSTSSSRCKSTDSYR